MRDRTGALSSNESTGRPETPLAPADQAAHRAASYVRPARAAAAAVGDSDPDADELLRRVHSPRSGLSVAVDAITAEQRATEENLAWQQREHGLAA